MSSTTTDSTVDLTKTISVSEDSLSINYRISLTDADVQRVQLVENLSEPVARSAVTFDSYKTGRWVYRSETELVFLADVESTEIIETTIQIESITLDPEKCSSTVTTTGPKQNGHRTNGGGDRFVPQPVRELTRSGSHERPAIGIVATADNMKAAARTTLRATERGFSVFVAVNDKRDTAARIAQRLGATSVTVDTDRMDNEEITARLARAARQQSYPGLLFHNDCHRPIEFEASLEAFESDTNPVVDTVAETAGHTVIVGIPAYNESETIADVVHNASEYVDEVLVVDDGSSDETVERALEAGATVVEHDENRGYGQALKTIFSQGHQRGADSLVVLDADGQHDPTDIPRLVEKQRDSGAEIVIGSRFGESTDTDIPLYRRFGLAVITHLTNLSIGRDARIRDPQSGFRSYGAKALKSLATNPQVIDDHMSASIDILSFAHDEGYDTAEVPTTIAYDVSNASTRNPITHGMNVLRKILETLQRNRPITVLGIPGVFLVLAGIGVGNWALLEFVADGNFSVLLLSLSALLIFTGTLSSFFSVVSHSLNNSRSRINA